MNKFNIDQLLKEIDETIAAVPALEQPAKVAGAKTPMEAIDPTKTPLDLADDLVSRGLTGCDADALRVVIDERGDRSIIEAIVEVGVDELDIAKLSTVITAKYGSTHAAQQQLGNVQDIQRTFIEFQEHLYKEAVG